MKKFTPLTSACIFAVYACLVLAASLYASDESVAGAASVANASVANKMESTIATKQGRIATGEAKQKAAPIKKEKKKAIQKEKPPVNVASVDFNVLKERLKDTDAIGFFTKLAIRNNIVDLVDKIKQYRKQSLLKAKMKEIRSSFDGLLLKIIALLEGDPKLSRDLYVGRESIWESLLEVKA